MNGKIEITCGERKAAQTCIETNYAIWAKDKDGVESNCHWVGEDGAKAETVARKVAANPDEYEDVLPILASEVKRGNTLIVKRTTRIVTWYEDAVLTVTPA